MKPWGFGGNFFSDKPLNITSCGKTRLKTSLIGTPCGWLINADLFSYHWVSTNTRPGLIFLDALCFHLFKLVIIHIAKPNVYVAIICPKYLTYESKVPLVN